MSGVPAPSRERLTELFLILTRIPSPSRSERGVADVVISCLEEIGAQIHEDDTGQATGGDTGNLRCCVRGDGTEPHLALGAHLDTVMPTGPIEPVLGDDGVFRNSSGTILGGDDKAAIAALLHATELLKASGRPFPSYELFFTVSEEIGLVGIKHLSENALSSPLAAVLDASGSVGGIVAKAPSMQNLRATFRGQAAHAGVEPERGRSAIQAAGRAVGTMQLGRLDKETSANIGVISGGVATNIVPDQCVIEGECRGHDEEKLAQVAAAMVDAIQEAAAQTGVDVDVSLVHEFRAFSLTGRSPVVRLAKAAVSALGLEPRILTAGGGSDANVLNGRGLPTINLDAGMMRVHSPDEFIALDELEKLCALVLQLIMLAPEYAPRPRSVAPDS
jgi:tripeptide aminopeptidase